MSERIFEGLDNLSFIGRGFIEASDFESGRRRHPDEAGQVVVGGSHMQENLAERTDPLGGTPGIFFGWNSFGQGDVALFEVIQAVDVLAACTMDRRSRSCFL